MPDNCKHFHQVAADENCQTILGIYAYITEDQFFEWNPVLNGDCNGLWANNWYCVGAYDGNNNPMPPTVTATPSPIPTKSPNDCAAWYFTTDDDTCDIIVSIFGTFGLEDFTAWNPSVFDDCSDITQNTWYCVGKADTPTTRTSGAPTPTEPAGEMPTQAGISGNCTAYWLVSEEDTCKSIAAANAITEESLKTWNQALGSECDGLKSDYYVCVSVDTYDPVTTLPPTQVSTKTSTTQASITTSGSQPITTPSPVRDGMASDCRRFYLMQSGDLCWSMAAAAGITTE